VTVVEAEKSYNTLARVKNFLRATMAQDRLSTLDGIYIARQLDYNSIIDTFANIKAFKELTYIITNI